MRNKRTKGERLLIELCGEAFHLHRVIGVFLVVAMTVARVELEAETCSQRACRKTLQFEPLALVAFQLADALLWFDDFGGFNEIT
jgi:hypothetical protein